MPEEIVHQDVLFRRVFLKLHIVARDNNRVSSAAFKMKNKQPNPECSVYVQRLMASPEEPMFTAKGGQGVVALSAAVPLNLGIAVIHDPVPFDPGRPEVPAQPGHAVMLMKTKEQCARLAAACVLVTELSTHET